MMGKEENKMKMITAIIEERDGDRTIKALNKEGFYCTKLAATGGFLKKSNLTILIGCEDEAVNSAIEIIKREAGSRARQCKRGSSYYSYSRRRLYAICYRCASVCKSVIL